MGKKRVLFLCTGNSCRSQLAEAIVNGRMGDSWQAFSAGSKPTGSVHPKAIAVLKEIGIQHEGRSKSMDEFRGQDFDLVVTVCADDSEECPVWLGRGKKIHKAYPDPAKTDNLQDFRAVRDGMIRDLLPLLNSNPPVQP